jgi:protein-disulfide isomerase
MRSRRLGLKPFPAAVIAAALLLLPVKGQDAAPEQCLGGRLDAPIRIEVYSDFQCPGCRVFYLETMKKVLQDYCALNKVCLIYREFPLNGHPYAREAARYSVAAQRLGRKQYQAVVESLYIHQPQWSENGKVSDAVVRALSPEDYQRLKKILQSASLNKIIDREVAVGKRMEITTTPTFIVTAGGREQRIVGVVPYPVLKDFFDRTLR